MTPLERLKTLLGIPDTDRDALLTALLDQARDTILAYTNRDALVPGLENAVVQLALVTYNRQGMEGEQAHGEGAVSRAFFAEDIPPGIAAQMNAYRLARAVTRG